MALSVFFIAPAGIACTNSPSQSNIKALTQWIETNRPHTVALKNIPDVVQYKGLSRQERATQCGDMCDHEDGKHDLNFYFLKSNRIALVSNARVDQLVHELVHAYQYAESSSTDGTDDSLEDEAIQYQKRFENEYGRTPVIWECQP